MRLDSTLVEKHEQGFITWVKHPEYPNYLVSNIGEIFSLKTSKILKKVNTRRGYHEVKLSKHSLAKTKLVHREIIKCFLGECDLTVNHKDGVKTNNNLDNLEYLSDKDNKKHAVELGLYESGINRFNSKLTLENIYYILNQKGKKSTNQLGKEFGVDQSTIVRIQNGQRYKREFKSWLDQEQK